jgi:hypothetical protein
LSPIFVGPQSSSSPLGAVGYAHPCSPAKRGTAQTTKLMRQLVDQAVGHQNFVRRAIDVVRGVPAHNDLAEASAIYEWVKRNIRYTKDPGKQLRVGRGTPFLGTTCNPPWPNL